MEAHVVLVGRRLADNENLGTGYLLAALERAGIRGRMEVQNGWTDMEGICARVVEAGPVVVGLSIPDGGSSFLPLGMGEMLRARGYRGHLTAGGGFATLARRWLLDRYGWLDSVVRFAGEVPLVELARRVMAGGAIDAIPGLTTRQGDGTPAEVLDRTQVEIVPRRDDLPEILGHRAAHVAATRGCPGRCDYCGPASLQRLERREGTEAGIEARTLACAGVGGTRRRSLDGLLDEMADLWHGRGVRYFYFVDEHVLPRREGEALEHLEAWKRGLSARGVGRLGIGCMLRADRLTPAVVDSFIDLGLVRCFVGLELATRAELRLYRRGGDPRRSVEIMRHLAQRGAATIGNLMLVHPFSTAASIEKGIGLLESMGPIPFEATEMQVYHGTRLEERLRAEGRLTGNPIRHGYLAIDPAAGRFREIFARLRSEVFHDYSLAFAAHDAMLAIGLASRLHPGSVPDAAGMDGIVRDLNSLRTAAWRRALETAISGRGHADADRLVSETLLASMEISGRIDRVTRALLASHPPPPRMFAPMKAAAAAVVGFVLAGGCSNPAPPPAEAPAAVEVETAQAPAPKDAGIEPDVAGQDVDGDPAAAEASGTVEEQAWVPACGMKKEIAARKKVEKIVKKVDPCGTVDVYFGQSIEDATFTTFDNDYENAYCTPRKIDVDGIKQALSSGLTASEIACLDGFSVFVEGKDRKDKGRLWASAGKKCPGVPGSSDWHRLLIEVGQDGKVVDVRAHDESHQPSPEAVACIKKALAGLVFPCLAGQAICPEWVIVE